MNKLVKMVYDRHMDVVVPPKGQKEAEVVLTDKHRKNAVRGFLETLTGYGIKTRVSRGGSSLTYAQLNINKDYVPEEGKNASIQKRR